MVKAQIQCFGLFLLACLFVRVLGACCSFNCLFVCLSVFVNLLVRLFVCRGLDVVRLIVCMFLCVRLLGYCGVCLLGSLFVCS